MPLSLSSDISRYWALGEALPLWLGFEEAEVVAAAQVGQTFLRFVGAVFVVVVGGVGAYRLSGWLQAGAGVGGGWWAWGCSRNSGLFVQEDLLLAVFIEGFGVEHRGGHPAGLDRRQGLPDWTWLGNVGLGLVGLICKLWMSVRHLRGIPVVNDILTVLC